MSCTAIWNDLSGKITEVVHSLEENFTVSFLLDGVKHELRYNMQQDCCERFGVVMTLQRDGKQEEFSCGKTVYSTSISENFHSLKYKMCEQRNEDSDVNACEFTFVGDNCSFTIITMVIIHTESFSEVLMTKEIFEECLLLVSNNYYSFE